MSTKLGSMPVSVLLIQTIVYNISKLVFLPLLKTCKSCIIGLPNTTVLMFAWNLPVSIGSLFLISFLEKNNICVTLSHPKYTKPQKGNKTDCKDARWICDLYMCGMVKSSFIPPADIRQLIDFVRYHFKLTCMITGKKIVLITVLLYLT